MKPKKAIQSYLLPVIAGLFSLLTLTDLTVFTNIPRVLVAVLGIIAAVLFFSNSPYFLRTMKIWVYSILPVVSWTEQLRTDRGIQAVSETPIWDVSPFIGPIFDFDIGIQAGLAFSGGMLNLGVNIIAIGLFVLYHFLPDSSIIGRTVTISGFRADNKLGDVFPMKGVVMETLRIEGENHWCLIDLGSPLIYAGKAYPALIVRDKGEEAYRPGKGRVSHIRLVDSPEKLATGSIKKGDYLFVDWGVVTLDK